jgi:serine/threonine protein kinase
MELAAAQHYYTNLPIALLACCTGLYEVIKVLGKGGTAETWLARDVKTEELVAVKLIKRPIPKLIVPMIMHEIQVSDAPGRAAASAGPGRGWSC